MQSSYEGKIRGLSIAVVVISGLSLLAFAALFAIFAALGPTLSDPTTYLDIQGSVGSYGSYSSMLDASSTAQYAGIGAAAISFYAGWAFICAAVSLASGIVGLLNCRRPDKMKLVFIWAIVGAVSSFVSGVIVTTILLVILAVMSSRQRGMAQDPGIQAQQVYGQPPSSPGQPFTPVQQGAPQQPYQQAYQQPSYQQAYQPPTTPAGQPPLPAQPQQPFQAAPPAPAPATPPTTPQPVQSPQQAPQPGEASQDPQDDGPSDAGQASK